MIYPDQVEHLLKTYQGWGSTYVNCRQLKIELQEIGWTCEISCEPFSSNGRIHDVRPIDIKENKVILEWMQKQGHHRGISLQESLYHEDYNDLMQVVEVIKDLQVNTDEIDFVLTCDLRFDNLYDAVVEFIKQQ